MNYKKHQLLHISDECDADLNQIVAGRMYNVIESFDILIDSKINIICHELIAYENGCTAYSINLELIFKTILGTTTEEEYSKSINDVDV